jgi:anthranilate synthase component 2/para-aminobenzoate synthetase component 2
MRKKEEVESMYFMLDNKDSFVYNLSAYFRELGEEILAKREEEITLSAIRALEPEGIVLSPGPGTPAQARAAGEVLRAFEGKVPILGVCLGHQVIGHQFGAKVEKGSRPMHGKLTSVHHTGRGVFAGLPQDFQAVRYHSLVVSGEEFPQVLSIDAVTPDGVVMGISHRTEPIYGVQFHPEAVLTQGGMELLDNFRHICQKWRAGVCVQ